MEMLGYDPQKQLAVTVSTLNVPAYRDPAVILSDQLKEISRRRARDHRHRQLVSQGYASGVMLGTSWSSGPSNVTASRLRLALMSGC
jgi:hypothetical protein